MEEAATPRPKTSNYAKITTAFANVIEYIQVSYGNSDYNLQAYIDQQAATADA